MQRSTIYIRFYEELNDFLPKKKQKTTLSINFKGKTSIKDIIESEGIPHAEIDLILANSQSVSFNYCPKNGEKISVYPVFETLDISQVTHLSGRPLRKTKFILDVHLGKLAKYLRFLGFDTIYENNFDDPEIVEIAIKEQRIILTRDIGILKRKAVTHGLWIRSQNLEKQLEQVIKRFNLTSSIIFFGRCSICNGIIKKTEKKKVKHLLKAKTVKYYDEFYKCCDCEQIYWKGSHYNKLEKILNTISNF